MKIKLKELLQQNKWEELKQLQSEIITSLKTEPGMIDARLIKVIQLTNIQDIIKCILPHDLVAALVLGRAIIELQQETNFTLPSDLAPTVYMLLYPTIFDPDESADKNNEDIAARKNERRAVIAKVERILKRPDELCKMIDLEMYFYQLIAAKFKK